MLRNLWMVAVGLLLAGAAVESQAGIVATWNFEAFTTAGGPTSYPADSRDTFLLNSASMGWTLGSSIGLAVGTGTGTGTKSFSFTAGNNKADGLNTTSPTAVTPGGTSFTLTLVANASRPMNTFTLTYDAKVVNSAAFQTGGPVNTWYYSVNGGSTWTAASTFAVAADGLYHPETVSFSVASIAGGGTILLRDTFTGGLNVNSASSMDFDNIVVSAVPEPTNLALAFFGVGFVAVALLRGRDRKSEV
jgi:hypothetical protein